MKKIAKSTLALVLAGTFTFSPIAMAQDNTSDDYKTVDLQTVSPEEIDDAKTQVEELAETNPSLIPGDFFYFAKIALEKIRLAFTFDKAEEAELLATYAAERLAEASELFAAGKEDEALEVIESAVEYMENSQVIVDGETSTDEGEKEEDTETEEEPNSDEETDSEDETVTEEDAESEEGKTSGDDVVSEDEENAEDDAAENPYDEIEGIMKQNIIALKAAMEHVGNDTARAALQRNIDKTYAKMAKKLAKLEEKYAEKQEEEKEATEPAEAEPVETDLQPADQEVPVEEPTDETMPADDDTTVVPVVSPAKAVKEQAKQQKKAEKAAVKQERKAAKQEVKQQKNEAKSQAKKERTEKKAQSKQQKGNDGKGKGNGKN